MTRKISLLLLVTLLTFGFTKADEGMWIPSLLKKYNIEDMQKAGFKLTAEDIYDVNKACLKDAIVGLGRAGRPFWHFCSGELISDEGLFITNHHCGMGAIQSHSSLEHNYLRDGFWAMSKSEELANPGITASFLIKIEDVTKEINEAIASANGNGAVVNKKAQELIKKATEGTNYLANIKPFFNGNQYFLSVYKIYKDVRLVGAPPVSIGKFGGDTDNWAWPRHTGDFSMFRIYADENNEPAEFSTNNKPYKPKYSLTISLKGVHEGDFTMVFGYPGTTKEYLTSHAIKQVVEIENPEGIAIRTKKLNQIKASMEKSESLRIKYSAKAAHVANSWKRWIGEINGLNRFNTIQDKQNLEKKFTEWVNQSSESKEKYGKVLTVMESLYNDRAPYVFAKKITIEAGLRGAELVEFALKADKFAASWKTEKEGFDKALAAFTKELKAFYKDYDEQTDKNIFTELISHYIERCKPEFLPEALKKLKKEDVAKYANKVYKKSVLSNSDKGMAFFTNYNPKQYKKFSKDPIVKLANSILDTYKNKISGQIRKIDGNINQMYQLWIAGLMEMQKNKTFYPDANSSLRVAYGTIGGYKPKDGVYYKHYTTLTGIMEKDNPDIYDYKVAAKLKELYKAKDYGKYTQEGEVPVCFVANNHTTGGNSGSPVLNDKGELIGVNFDRAWEGVMSDMKYDPNICRNIALDIRYALFIIDKFAGAGHLIEEMKFAE
jgi:hypothetical protein